MSDTKPEAKRVSRSVLDPYLFPLVPRLYRLLRIPRAFPPEGIVVAGHAVAIVAAFGFAFATRFGWGGLLVALGVAGNHLADMVDGTHARTTGQCRNSGELLDHFLDPLSFSYWTIGWAVSIASLPLALAAVLVLYATALLTSLRAKLTGEFRLARFGPTEMKATLVLYGLAMFAFTTGIIPGVDPLTAARLAFWALLVVGVVQLGLNLAGALVAVNRIGAPPDTTAWVLRPGREEGRPEPPESEAE